MHKHKQFSSRLSGSFIQQVLTTCLLRVGRCASEAEGTSSRVTTVFALGKCLRSWGDQQAEK